MENKREIAWHKGELNKHLELLKQQLSLLKTQKVSEIQIEIQSIKDYYQRLKISDTSIESEINNLLEQLRGYNEKYQEIAEYYEQIFNSTDDEIGIKEKIEAFQEMIKSYEEDLLFGKDGKKSIKKQIEETYNDILGYHKYIFGTKESKDTDGKIIAGTIGFKKNLENFKIEKENEFSTLRQKIETLLPGATSAGLSSAYKDMKDSFEVPKWIWSITFICTLGIFITLGRKFQVGNSYEEAFLNILAHAGYILPLIWLAYFASKQQSQNIRLQQEYAHKESLAKSFEGYKKQIDALGNDKESLEIKKMLMKNIVQMTGENPSDTLDKNHGTNPPFWEYIFGNKDKKGTQ